MAKDKVKPRARQLDRDLIEIAKLAANEVLKSYITMQRDYWFGRTKLLLNHYNDFRSLVISGKATAKDVLYNDDEDLALVDDYIIEDYDPSILEQEDDVFIDSIMRNKAATIIMIAHINTCLRLLCAKVLKDDKKIEDKTGSHNETNYNKYRLLKLVYFYGNDITTVGDQFYISEATARRWANEMIRELSVLLFGASGVQLR